jgi:hypothetical protein
MLLTTVVACSLMPRRFFVTCCGLLHEIFVSISHVQSNLLIPVLSYVLCLPAKKIWEHSAASSFVDVEGSTCSPSCNSQNKPVCCCGIDAVGICSCKCYSASTRCSSQYCAVDENNSAITDPFDDANDGDEGETSNIKKGLRAALPTAEK